MTDFITYILLQTITLHPNLPGILFISSLVNQYKLKTERIIRQQFYV